jgi:uncharacterized protein
MNFKDPRQKKLLKKARKLYAHPKMDQAHQLDHIKRVLYWIVKIAKKEKGNLNILIPAALLHDIAIPEDNSKHAVLGAIKAKPILKQAGYSKKEIEEITKTIELHSQDDPSMKKRTKDGNILWDADKLDCTGQIAFQRWTRLHPTETPQQIAKRILEKYKFLRKTYGKDIFYTKTAKNLAKPRIKKLETLCKQIIKDCKKFEKVKI